MSLAPQTLDQMPPDEPARAGDETEVSSAWIEACREAGGHLERDLRDKVLNAMSRTTPQFLPFSP